MELADIAIDVAPIDLINGINRTTSGVAPLFDKRRTTSEALSLPRSPCKASLGCKKILGVPVLESVAEIFWPIRPAFPNPLTIMRPLQFIIASHIASKDFGKLSLRFFKASASKAKTCFPRTVGLEVVTTAIVGKSSVCENRDLYGSPDPPFICGYSCCRDYDA